MARSDDWTYFTYPLLLVMTVAAFLFSLSAGPVRTRPHDYVEAFLSYDASLDAHFALRQLRLPRTILAALIGASLSVSGAIMQAVTRNPLAGPSTMGLSSSGTLAVLIGILTLPQVTYSQAIGLSFAGSIVGFLIVHAVSHLAAGRWTSTSLALAGTVVSSVFASITHGLTLYFSMHDELLYWTVGGISSATWEQIGIALPICLVGLLTALWISHSLTLLSLGTDVATGLGQRVVAIRAVATLTVLALTGVAVAVAGPIAFVGVMAPHIARMLTGADFRRVIPACIVLGATITMSADALARGSTSAEDVPLGLFTTLIGAPVFVYLINRRPGNRG